MLPLFFIFLAVCRRVEGRIVPADASKNISWPYHVYKTTDFTPPYLDISPRSTSPGFYFLAPNGATAHQVAPIIADNDGELVWNGPRYLKAFGFGVQEYRGEKVIAAWNGSGLAEPLGRGHGYITLWNKFYEPVANVTLPGAWRDGNATYPTGIDLHELFITDRGTLLVTANNVTQADLTCVGGARDGWVVEAQVYEIDIASHRVLFAWKSLDHREALPLAASLYPLGTDGQDGGSAATAWGYFHINSVAPLGRDGYVVSSRYLSSAIALDAATGGVAWRVQGLHGNGFSLGRGADFRYQHHIRVVSRAPTRVVLSLFDNHNCPTDRDRVPAAGKLLDIDLAARHVRLRARYADPARPVFPTAQGSFHPIHPSGHHLLAHGWIPVLQEFSPAGAPLSTLQFGPAVRRPGGGFLSGPRGTLSYRASKQAWVGCPRSRPAVRAESVPPSAAAAAAAATRVYVSWNGATEVQAWKIYAGVAALAYIRTVPRAGFETSVDLAAAVRFVQVEAVLRPGAPHDCVRGDGARSDLVFTHVPSS